MVQLNSNLMTTCRFPGKNTGLNLQTGRYVSVMVFANLQTDIDLWCTF